MNCTCLVPAHNEASRIEAVLKTLLKASLIEKIIVINDGSTDQTKQIVEKKFPQIKLISFPENHGKAFAVRQGLQHVNTSHVLLIDADLINLDEKILNSTIKLITTQSKLDMIILKRIHEVKNVLKNKFNNPKIIKFLLRTFPGRLSQKATCLLSGERIIKTKLLKTILTDEIKNYNLEVAINQYCLDKQKQVCWMPSQALNDFKSQELGTYGLMKKYILMNYHIAKYIGFKRYMKQVNSFCTENCQNNQPYASR